MDEVSEGGALARPTQVEVQRLRQCRVTLPEGEVWYPAARCEGEGEFAAPCLSLGALFGHHSLPLSLCTLNARLRAPARLTN